MIILLLPSYIFLFMKALNSLHFECTKVKLSILNNFGYWDTSYIKSRKFPSGIYPINLLWLYQDRNYTHTTNTKDFTIEQQIARHYVPISECLSNTLPFYENQIINPFLIQGSPTIMIKDIGISANYPYTP